MSEPWPDDATCDEIVGMLSPYHLSPDDGESPQPFTRAVIRAAIAWFENGRHGTPLITYPTGCPCGEKHS